MGGHGSVVLKNLYRVNEHGAFLCCLEDNENAYVSTTSEEEEDAEAGTVGACCDECVLPSSNSESK